MYKILYIALLIALSGCTPANKLNMAKSKFLCAEHGGVYSFEGYKKYPITCVNGTRFSEDVLAKTIITDPKYVPQGIK